MSRAHRRRARSWRAHSATFLSWRPGLETRRRRRCALRRPVATCQLKYFERNQATFSMDVGRVFPPTREALRRDLDEARRAKSGRPGGAVSSLSIRFQCAVPTRNSIGLRKNSRWATRGVAMRIREPLPRGAGHVRETGIRCAHAKTDPASWWRAVGGAASDGHAAADSISLGPQLLRAQEVPRA